MSIVVDIFHNFVGIQLDCWSEISRKVKSVKEIHNSFADGWQLDNHGEAKYELASENNT